MKKNSAKANKLKIKIPPAKAGGNSKLEAIQSWKQFKAGGNSKLEAIQNWKQFRAGGNLMEEQFIVEHFKAGSNSKSELVRSCV